MYEDELKHLSEKMDKSIQALRNEFTSIRTGQASPSLLDRVFVDYYGSKTPVTQVASVTVPVTVFVCAKADAEVSNKQVSATMLLNQMVFF